MFGLADLTRPGPGRHDRAWAWAASATDMLPCGPGGPTRPCVQCALYLVSDADGRLALLLRGPDEHGPMEDVTVEVVATDAERRPAGPRTTSGGSRIEHNVFRGQVIAFGGEMFGHATRQRC